MDAAAYDVCRSHWEWCSAGPAIFRTGMNGAASTHRGCENGRLAQTIQVEAEYIRIRRSAAGMLAHKSDGRPVKRDACLIRNRDVAILRERIHRRDTDRIRAGDRRAHQRVVVCIVEESWCGGRPHEQRGRVSRGWHVRVIHDHTSIQVDDAPPSSAPARSSPGHEDISIVAVHRLVCGIVMRCISSHR